MSTTTPSAIVQEHRPGLEKYESLYKHLHQNPELSNQEHKTAALVAQRLSELSHDFDIRPNIGGTGVIGILHNGAGPKVLLRADMDALPVAETTGLPYASSVRMTDHTGVERPIMHACGHDMHMTCLLAATELLVAARQHWSGTLILAFQPAEERGTGARAMIDDGMYDPQRHAVPIPDVCIGGHVTSQRSGTIGTRKGTIASSSDSFRVTLHGRGGHASQPHMLVDPVVMAAATIMRLQTIVSREVNPAEHAVVSVASVQAGNAENVIVDDVDMAVDVRAMRDDVRKGVLESVRRIIEAESAASGAPILPTITQTREFPLTVNDEDATARIEETFTAHFASTGDTFNANAPPLAFSEDFSILGTSQGVPTVFFMYGGTPPVVFDSGKPVPTNHSSNFAPAIMPTMRIGLDAYALSALTWLARTSGVGIIQNTLTDSDFSAGVIGLQTAVILLEHGYTVTILAEHFPGDEDLLYASPWAGAHWRTHAKAADVEQCRWDIETYRAWGELVDDEERRGLPRSERSGITRAQSIALFDAEALDDLTGYVPSAKHAEISTPGAQPSAVIKSLWWADQVDDFHILDDTPPDIAVAAQFTAFTVAVPTFLAYLMNKFQAGGGQSIKYKLESGPTALTLACSIAQDAQSRSTVDAVVNATGLRAKECWNDDKMFPIRGQIVLVRGEAKNIKVRQGVDEQNKPYIAYVIPRYGEGTTVLGGSNDKHSWDGSVSEQLTRSILHRTRTLCPELLTGKDCDFDVIKCVVGLRPARDGGARLELDTSLRPHKIVHAYGFAGAGYQNSVGVARRVLQLVKAALNDE
ncbi:hypothetical protein MRB53_039244 [Persea americana]|nr:hypothetical protein MRB53_039244 [Persea americana]